MKKLVFILVAALCLAACSEEKESNLHISGSVEGLRDGILFLQKIEEDTLLVNVDSLKIGENSNFDFRTYLESPEIMFLYLDKKEGQKNDNIIPFFAEKGKMSIQTSLDDFSRGAKITGSENQQKWEEYKKAIRKYNDRNLELIQQNFEASKNKNEERLEKINRQFDQLLRAKYLFTVNYAINHKDMEIAPYLAISEIYDANIKFLDTIYNSLTNDIRKSIYGKSLKKLLKERKKLERMDKRVERQ